MLWVLLAVTTTVAATALGTSTAVFVNRRRIVRRPDTFPCRVRVVSGEEPGLSPSWLHTVHYGFWVHDVLVLRHGIGLLRTQLLPTASACGSVRPLDPAEPSGLGVPVLGLTLLLDDETSVDVAVPGSARDLVLGPFLLAGLDEARAGVRSRPGDSRE